MKKLTYALLCIFTVFGVLGITVFADFGNFDTYESDFGTSDWGSSYDSSWDSGGYGSSIYFDDNYYYDSDSDGDDNISIFAVILIVAVIIAVSVLSSKMKGGAKTGTSSAGRVSMPSGTVTVPVRGSYANRTAEIQNKIIAYDPEFTSGKLLGLVKECYVKFQSAWTKRDLSELRVLQSEEFFSQSRMQIEEYIRLGKINVMERVSVGEVFLVDHRIDNSREYIDVFLTATQKDYIIDEKTGNVLEGNPNGYRKVSYIVTVMRSEGEKTSGNDGVKVANCPNCGAPLDVTAAGKCAYCGSVLSTDSHAWVISAMRRA